MKTLEKPESDILLWENLEKQDDNILKWNQGIDQSKLSEREKNLLNLYEGQSTGNIKPVEEGQIIEGVIESISKKEVAININYKDFVYVESNSADWKFLKNFKPGDPIKVLITSIEYPHFKIKGSISELIKMDVENRIKDYYNEKTPIDAKVIEKNSAGFVLKLEINGIELDAFMPNTIAACNRLTSEQSEKFVGKNIKVCLETLKEDKGLYVVSRKKYLKEHLFPQEVKKLKKGYEKVYIGYITGTTPFGVFVEFAASEDCPRSLTGMIHKVNLNSNLNIKDLRPGMGMEFFVKDVLKNGKEIVLTQVKRESLWDVIKSGEVYEAEVISNKHFGSLVKLDEETSGVIQNKFLNKANKKLNVGDKIDVKVISVIKDDRKIYLDLA